MFGQLNALGLHSCDIGNLFHMYILIKIYLFLLCRHSCSFASFLWCAIIWLNVDLGHVHDIAFHNYI